MTQAWGDREAFEAFVRSRTPALLRSAQLLTGDRHLAEDLLQETFARVAHHWSRVHAEGTPEAYARAVLYSRAVDSWRWRRRRAPEVYADAPFEPAPGGPDDALAEDVARRAALQGALARLTPKQRAVLVLRFYEDRSESETVAVLGCSVGTVKSQTRHALDRIRVLAPDLAGAFGPRAAQPPADEPAHRTEVAAR